MSGKELSNKNVLMTYSHDNVPGCKLRIRGVQADAVLVMLGSLAVRGLFLTIRSDSQPKRAISCRNYDSFGGNRFRKVRSESHLFVRQVGSDTPCRDFMFSLMT